MNEKEKEVPESSYLGLVLKHLIQTQARIEALAPFIMYSASGGNTELTNQFSQTFSASLVEIEQRLRQRIYEDFGELPKDVLDILDPGTES